MTAPEPRSDVSCAVLHVDAEGNAIPCPGYPHKAEIDALVALLTEHEYRWTTHGNVRLYDVIHCAGDCDWSLRQKALMSDDYVIEQHRQHVAEVIFAQQHAADGCDCTELCPMGPTCPGGMLAGLPGSGCSRSSEIGSSPAVAWCDCGLRPEHLHDEIAYTCTCTDPGVACPSCVATRDRNGWPKDWQERMRERMRESFCPGCGKAGVVVGLDSVLRETRPEVRPHTCGVGGPGSTPEPPTNIGDTCCGQCAGGSCYVDQVTGA